MTENSLGDFLRARRARLRTTELGIVAPTQRRRVPGLRREEVAQMAAISTDYYTRLEQGRIQPSAAVLTSVADALQLDAATTDYVCTIAGLTAQAPAATPPVHDAQQLALVQSFIDDLHMTPVFVVGPRTEILAWNDLAAAMITDFAVIPESQRYFIRLLITDPAMRGLYADWEEVTRISVEQLRALNATTPDDPELCHLVQELRAIDPEFASWWNAHAVEPRTSGMKVLRHPVVGELHLDWMALTWNTVPDWQLIAWKSPAETPTHQRLQLLARHSKELRI